MTLIKYDRENKSSRILHMEKFDYFDNKNEILKFTKENLSYNRVSFCPKSKIGVITSCGSLNSYFNAFVDFIEIKGNNKIRVCLRFNTTNLKIPIECFGEDNNAGNERTIGFLHAFKVQGYKSDTLFSSGIANFDKGAFVVTFIYNTRFKKLLSVRFERMKHGANKIYDMDLFNGSLYLVCERGGVYNLG